MKKLVAIVLAMVLLITLAPAALAYDERPDNSLRMYTLNIIGVDNPKTADMSGNNGHRIFVNLNDPSPIYLKEAKYADGSSMPYTDPDAFAVLDANGTDSNGALFQMPKPGLLPYNITTGAGQTDTWSDYSIFIRSLGKPGGWATITTCAQLVDSTFAGLLSGKFLSVVNRAGLFGGYASIEQVGQSITERPKGKSGWTNVTAELTTIVFQVNVEVQATTDVNGDGVINELDTVIVTEYVRVPIFDPILDGEYWEYDNNGLKLLQVWFYDVSTDVSENDLPAWQ